MAARICTSRLINSALKLAANVSEDAASLMAATQRPVTDPAAFGGAPAWKTIPSWLDYLRATRQKYPGRRARFHGRGRRAKETVEVKGASHVDDGFPSGRGGRNDRASGRFVLKTWLEIRGKLIPMARKYLELSVTPAVPAAQGHYYGHARSFRPARPALRRRSAPTRQNSSRNATASICPPSARPAGRMYSIAADRRGFCGSQIRIPWRSPICVATLSFSRRAT